MENQNANLIRTYINLFESLNKTISLNGKNFINETKAITNLARGKNIVGPELEGFLKTMKQNTGTNKLLTDLKITNVDDLLLAVNRGSKQDKRLLGTLELTILKSNTSNTKLIDAATSSLVKDGKFIEKYTKFKNQGQPQLEAALKQAGYSDRAITSIVNKFQTSTKGSPRAFNTTPRNKTKKVAIEKTKSIVNNPNNAKVIDEIKLAVGEGKDLGNGVKKWTIGDKVFATVMALGGIGILYAILSRNGDGSDVELEKQDGTQLNPPGSPKATPLTDNEGPKITEFTCKVPGDKNYAYTFKDNNWFALNLKNKQRFNLTYLLTSGFPGYKKTIDVLVKTCPTQQPTSDSEVKIPFRNVKDVFPTPQLTNNDLSQFNVNQ
jgi:hypothetical protein